MESKININTEHCVLDWTLARH